MGASVGSGVGAIAKIAAKGVAKAATNTAAKTLVKSGGRYGKTLTIKQPSMQSRIKSITQNPKNWRVVRQQVERSRNNKTGWSIETQLRHKKYPWIKINRHTLTKKGWKIVERHYRSYGKFR